MGKILIVEDDQFFREAISDLLQSKNFEVLEAENGKVAQEIFLVHDIDLVISDIQMPNLTGTELLKWCKEKRPNVPFLLMTGFSMLLETQTAYEMGADEFITKPFDRNEFLDKIKKISLVKDPENQTTTVDADDKYCRIRIDEFVSRSKLEFDVYLRFAQNRYTKIANLGDAVDKDRLENYKNKGVEHLYLTKQDFKKMIELNLNLSRILKNRNDIATEKKMSFLKHTGEIILEKAFSKGLDAASFQEAEEYLKITTEVLSGSDAHFNLLDILNQHSDDVYAHSVGVALLSTMIAKRIGFESSLSLNKITMAALFHDIGKKEIDKNILDKPRYLQTNEERRIYETHSLRGKEILESMKTVSDDVVQIVAEHHEDIIEQKLVQRGANVKKQHPLTRIIHCANLFVEFSMKTTSSEGCDHISAIKKIEEQYQGRVDKECLTAIKKMYKMI
jgi:putative nucleotidyltransferase with HDIG domain